MDHYGVRIVNCDCNRMGKNMKTSSRLMFVMISILIGQNLFAQSPMHHDMHAKGASASVTASLPEKFIASKDRSYNELNAEAMAIMDRDMMKEKSQNNPDVDFAVMMIPHHQGAIDMAKVLLLHGKDPEMKNLALQIITDQQTEIDQMKAWLKRQTNKKENKK